MQSWAVGSRLENNNRSSSEYGWDAKKAGNGLAAMRAEAAPGSAMWPSGSNDAATTFLLRRQVASWGKVVDAAELELTRRIQETRQLKVHLKASKAEVASLHKAIKGLEQTNARLKETIQSHEDDCPAKLGGVPEIQDRLRSAQAELAFKARYMSDKENHWTKEAAAMDERIQDQKRDIESLTLQIKEKDDAISRLSTQEAAALAALGAAEEKQGDLQRQLEETKARNVALEADNKGLDSKIAALETTAKERDSTGTQQLEDLEREVVDFRQLASRYETGIVALLDTMGVDEQQCIPPPRESDSAQATIATSRGWADASLQKAIAGVARQQAAFRELREQYYADKETNAQKILELKRSIMDTEDQVSDLQTEFDIRIDTEITRTDQRMSDLKQKGASMEKALQKALASAEQLSAVHLEALASNKKINDADIKQLTWELNQLASTALSLSSAGARGASLQELDQAQNGLKAEMEKTNRSDDDYQEEHGAADGGGEKAVVYSHSTYQLTRPLKALKIIGLIDRVLSALNLCSKSLSNHHAVMAEPSTAPPSAENPKKIKRRTRSHEADSSSSSSTTSSAQPGRITELEIRGKATTGVSLLADATCVGAGADACLFQWYHAQIEALPADDSSVDWSPIENATFQSYCTSAADIGWCLRAEARLVAKRASRSGSTRIASTAKASIGPIQLSSSTESLVSDLIEKGDAQFEVKSSAADQFRGRTLLLHVNKQSGVRLDDGDDELFSLPWKESILCEISPGDHNRLTILTVEGFEFPLETWSHETSDAIFLTIDAFSGDYDLAARPDTEHGGDRGKRASDSTALSPGRVAEPNEIHHANVRAMGGTSQSSKQSTNGDEDNDASPEQLEQQDDHEPAKPQRQTEEEEEEEEDAYILGRSSDVDPVLEGHALSSSSSVEDQRQKNEQTQPRPSDNDVVGKETSGEHDDDKESAQSSKKPGVQDLEVLGTATLGSRLQVCGTPTNGTKLCLFQWLRTKPGSMLMEELVQIPEAKAPTYTVSLDDVGCLLAVRCQPMDPAGRKGDSVVVFAEDGQQVVLGTKMEEMLERAMPAGTSSKMVGATFAAWQIEKKQSRTGDGGILQVEAKRWRFTRRNRVVFKGEYGEKLRLLIPAEDDDVALTIHSTRKKFIELEFESTEMRNFAAILLKRINEKKLGKKLGNTTTRR